MEHSFLTDIYIQHIRHLQKIHIPISTDTKKHLIITGKNGSGKTSVLSNIRNAVASTALGWMNTQQDILNNRNNFASGLANVDYNMKQISENIRNQGVGDFGIDQQRINIESYQRTRRDYDSLVNYFDGFITGYPPIHIGMKNIEHLQNLYPQGQFVVHLFDAKRTSYVGSPNGIYNQNITVTNSILNSANPNFLQYIVNLRAEQSFARDENDIETVEQIQNWFHSFTEQLSNLFNNDSLRLKFDRRRFNFFIELPDRQPFDFNSMSDGYSAILSIVTEIIMRMARSNTHDTQGIVLIDEIETHLHIDLQKKIMPFLTGLFPNIQFIVSSHSPFVLNSISDTVVYDLEKNIRVEDLSGYSMEGIVEGYFRQDKYSDEVKKRLVEYEELSYNDDKNIEQQERFTFLKNYFKELPKFYSEELELKLNQIQLATM